MKKTFFKSVVATAVVTAAMALSSTAVFAALYTDTSNESSWDGSSTLTIDYTSASSLGSSPVTGIANGIYYYNVKYSTGDSRIELFNSYDSTNYGTGSYITITPDFDVTMAGTVSNKDITVSGSDSSSNTLSKDTGAFSITLDEGVTYTFTNAATSGTGRAYLTGDITFTKVDSSGTTTESTTETTTEAVERQSISSDVFISFDSDDYLTYGSGSAMATNTVFKNYFETEGTKLKITSSSKTYGNQSYSYRLQTGGSNQAFMFTVTDAALIQVVFTTGSDGSTRSCYIGSTSGASDVGSASTNGQVDTSTYVPTAVTGALPSAGTYYISCDNSISIYSINIVFGATLTQASDTTTAGAYVNGTNAYAIAAVSADAASTATALNIGTSSDATAIATTDTVYDTVCVDNFVFTASDVTNGTADYVYAALLTDADDTAATNITTKAVVATATE